MIQMRKFIEYALLCGCILALSACSEKIDPVEPGLGDGPEISFSIGAQAVGTKGLINPTSSTDPGLAVQGTQLHVYDYLTGFTGTVGGVDYDADDVFPYINGTLQYINETPGEKNENYWQFVDSGAPAFYRWTKTGVHNFFAWLVKDMSGNPALTPTSLFGSELTLTDARVLNVPQVTFTPTSPQFDFLYSNIIPRDASLERDRRTVDLLMRHLFTAFALTIENHMTEGSYTVKSVTIENIPNQGSATVSFAGDESAVTYSTPVVNGQFIQNFAPASGMELAAGKAYDLIGGGNLVDYNTITPEYRLLWPVLSRTLLDEVTFTVVYTMEDYVDEETGQLIEISVPVKIPNAFQSWQPGTKNHYALIFSDKEITLVYSVEPWEVVKTDLDFAAHSLSASQLVLTDYGERVDNTFIVSTNAAPIIGTFQIWAPVGAEWLVSMSGDTGFFTLLNHEGTVDPSVDNGRVVFQIVPNQEMKQAHPGTEARITLHFTVETSEGDVINGDSEINRDNFEIVY